MNAPVAAPSCPRCHTSAGPVDDYCGGCGQPLTAPRLSRDHVVVTGGRDTVRIEVQNQGVMPTACVLRELDRDQLPSWVERAELKRAAGPDDDGEASGGLLRGTTLPPTGRIVLEVDLAAVPERGAEVGHHTLPLLTSVLEVDPRSGALRRRVLEVRLATEGRPRVSPGGLWFRFLPRSRLSDGGVFAERFTVKNEGGHPVELVGVDVREHKARPFPANWKRLDAAAAVVVQSKGQHEQLAPGQAHDVGFGLRLPDDALAPGEVGVIAARLGFRFRGHPTQWAELGAVVAEGPSLKTEVDLPLIARCQGRRTTLGLEVQNPGLLPLSVLDVEVLGAAPSDGPAPMRAAPPGDEVEWLHTSLRPAGPGAVEVAQSSLPLVLGPGQRAHLQLVLDPSRRGPEEMDEAWGQARVRIHHDGYENVESRFLDIPVKAELGRVKVLKRAVLGVDFGTSNSSTCLFHGETSAGHPLRLDPAAGTDELASLLFYRGLSDGDPDQRGPFLFGQAAENAASLRWANLVRSIKSVVARDPTTNWIFLGQQRGQLASYKSQALLEAFVGELKARSEAGIRSLPTGLLEQLGLSASGARFAEVVFTHPVGASDEVLGALYQAARAADLVPEDATFQSFKSARTLDEALAATVAFAHVVAGAEYDPLSIDDEERILCVDVGGGTTDMAAVKAGGLASFRGGLTDGVTLTLMASGGDDRFGGDDIDRLLASRILEKIEDEVISGGPTGSLRVQERFDTDAVRRALQLPSFESFRRHELDRVQAAGGTGQVGGASEANAAERAVEQRAQTAFSAASDLLRVAEAAKCRLGETEVTRVSPQVVDWPTRPGHEGRLAGLRLDVELSQPEVQALYRAPLQACASRVLPLCQAAGWRPADLSAVLFTGQGTRLRELRETILQTLNQGREGAAPLKVVAPGSLPGFDAKHCVALGAAVWGDSQSGGGGWLRIERRSTEMLSYTLATRRGPRFAPVDGLESGAPFPARARHRFAGPSTALSLYRQRRLLWAFELPRPVEEVEVVVVSDREAHLVLDDGARVEGVRHDDV